MERSNLCMEPWPKPAPGGWHYLRIEEPRQGGGTIITGFAWTSIIAFEVFKTPGDEDLMCLKTSEHQIIIAGSGLDVVAEEIAHRRIKVLRVGRCEDGSRKVRIDSIQIKTDAEMQDIRNNDQGLPS